MYRFVQFGCCIRRFGLAADICGLLIALSVVVLSGTLPLPLWGQGAMISINVGSQRSGAPVVINGQNYVTPAAVQVDSSKPIRVTAAESFFGDPGWKYGFESWHVYYSDGNVDNFYHERSLTLDGTKTVVRLHAYYSERILLKIQSRGPGRVDVDPQPDSDGYFRAPDMLTLRAVPDPGARFIAWEGKYAINVSDTLQMSFYIPQTVVARFAPLPENPPEMTVEGTFPKLRYRTTPELKRGTVRLVSNGFVYPSGYSGDCNGKPPIYGLMVGESEYTPIDLTIYIVEELADKAPDGEYSCILTVKRADMGPPTRIPLSIQLGPDAPDPASPKVEAAVDGASYRPLPLAAGSIFSLFGERLANGTAKAELLPLPTRLEDAEVRVTVGGLSRMAPMFYASPGQLNFLVPPDLPSGGGFMEVIRDGLGGPPFPVVLEPLAPALFTANSDGKGAPAGYYIRVLGDEQIRGELYACPEGSPCEAIPIVSPDANEEVFLILFGTGFRNFTSIAPELRIDGTQAEVTYVGPHPDFVGLDQINVKVPRFLIGSGVRTVTVKHLGKEANTVTIHF